MGAEIRNLESGVPCWVLRKGDNTLLHDFGFVGPGQLGRGFLSFLAIDEYLHELLEVLWQDVMPRSQFMFC